MPAVTLGGIKAESVVAGLSESKNGSISDPNYAVNVGSGFLKRYVATFDYAHQTMYLKPIAPPPVDAGRFDRSGLWINAKSGGYEVTDVAAGGAGARAGFAVGDVILAIDGRPVRPEGLSEARILLRAKPVGTKVQMQVKRGADTREVTLVLQDQI
jgi:predicted metalloprotease with PDZ domain